MYDQFLKAEQNRIISENQAKKLGEEFVHDYPIERIKSLSLDEYMLAKMGYGNPHSFCRRLRYDLQPMASMGNAWPDVFGVYLKNGYEITLSKGLRNAFGDNYKEAFDYIKQEITDLLHAAVRDDYRAIERCSLNSIFKYKLLLVYFPDKYIPVCARPTLEGYCKIAGVQYNPNEEMVYANLRLLERKKSDPRFASRSNYFYMGYLDYALRIGQERRIYVYKDSPKAGMENESSYATRDSILNYVSEILEENIDNGFSYRRGVSNISCSYQDENVCFDIYTRVSWTAEDSEAERGPKIKVTLHNYSELPEYEVIQSIPAGMILHAAPVWDNPNDFVFYVPMAYCRQVLQLLCAARSNRVDIEETEALEAEIESLQLKGQDKEAIVKQRVNQHVFRDRLLKKYNKCVLCGMSNPDLLTASHIKPWRDSDETEKLSIYNGFLMCPNHDRLFDRGYISFSEDGSILISDDLSTEDRIFLNIHENYSIELKPENLPFLKYHRDFILRK